MRPRRFPYVHPCPSCNGSGRDRLIPESEIRAWMDRHKQVTGADLREWLDERSER